jgi:predicted nucleic acid-binding protein
VLLIDTGIFVSAADRDEPRHDVCAGLLRGRRDLTVTASIIAVAERHNLDTIATLNHRDFAVVKPAHRNTLTLIP